MARPCLRASQPIPPPRVRPAMPTLPVSPNGVARPWAAAATVYSSARRPGWAQASRRSGSMWRPFIAPRSRTIPPSDVLWPARLWLPPRTASSRPVSRAKTTVRATSPALAAWTISAGRRSTCARWTWRASSYVGVVRSDDRPGEAGDEGGDVGGVLRVEGGDAGEGHGRWCPFGWGVRVRSGVCSHGRVERMPDRLGQTTAIGRGRMSVGMRRMTMSARRARAGAQTGAGETPWR